MNVAVCPKCGDCTPIQGRGPVMCSGVECLILSTLEIEEARRIVDKSRTPSQFQARCIGADPKIVEAATALIGQGGRHAHLDGN